MFARSCASGFGGCVLFLGFLGVVSILSSAAQASTVNVPNYSFETQGASSAWTLADWQCNADTNAGNGGGQWNTGYAPNPVPATDGSNIGYARR